MPLSFCVYCDGNLWRYKTFYRYFLLNRYSSFVEGIILARTLLFFTILSASRSTFIFLSRLLRVLYRVHERLPFVTIICHGVLDLLMNRHGFVAEYAHSIFESLSTREGSESSPELAKWTAGSVLSVPLTLITITLWAASILSVFFWYSNPAHVSVRVANELCENQGATHN